MPHTKSGILFSFLIAFAAFIVSSSLVRFEVHFFVPPIVMLLTNSTITTTAWVSLGTGLFVDAATHSPRLGFIALAYLFATYTLHSCKRMLTRDSFAALLILTYAFSLIASLYEILLSLILDIPLPSYAIGWMMQEIFVMPLADAIYAFVIFSLPQFLLSRYHVRRRA